jgi:hypothetical protein
MMNFRVIKEGLITLLGNEAAGRYVTLGYQKQGQRAEELLDDNRNIQVYYSSGELPKSKSSLNGPMQHDITFNIDCMVSKRAQVDLSAIENPAATPAEKAVALAAMRPAGRLADDSLDELFDIVYQVLMDAENLDLSLDFEIANRWIERITKDSPIPAGEYCVLTGIIQLTCSIDEQVSGIEPVVATDGIHMDLLVNDELQSQAGVTNEFDFIIDDETGDLLIDDDTGDYLVDGGA